MISRGYSIDLYCDGKDEGLHPRYWEDNWKTDYSGETWAECAKQARQDGWYISRDRTKAYCPKCAKRKRKVKEVVTAG